MSASWIGEVQVGPGVNFSGWLVVGWWWFGLVDFFFSSISGHSINYSIGQKVWHQKSTIELKSYHKRILYAHFRNPTGRNFVVVEEAMDLSSISF